MVKMRSSGPHEERPSATNLPERESRITHHSPGARAPVSMAGLGRWWVGRRGLTEVVAEVGAWAGFGSNDLIGNCID